MLVYLLKFTTCLAILFVFYKIFLEKESIHKLKRFYLLGTLLFSLIVPGLVFTEYVESAPLNQNTYSTEEAIQPPADSINVPQALEKDVLDIEPLLWGIYFIGLFFFGIKFIRNLFQIFFRIRKNPKNKLAKITQVLLQEKITPHTFMSYIFLNKTKFENNQIPKEVLLHEETHAKQKHSWDVLLVELLQVIFWVNPLIYFSKKAIKLNHEFLADQAVLDRDIDATSYKNTLLSYLSPDSEKKYQTLANAINYSSIKKRFTVMKKHTSKKTTILKSLLILPLAAMLLFGFSETIIVQKELTSDIKIKDLNIEILKNGELRINNENIELDDISKKVRILNKELPTHILRNYVTANILYDETQVPLIQEVQTALHHAGISTIKHYSKQTAHALGRDGLKQSSFNGKTILEAQEFRREQIFNQSSKVSESDMLMTIVWIEIKNENEIWLDNEQITTDDLSKKIALSYRKNNSNPIEVQIYATGILKSEFVEKLQKEIEKIGVKRISVFSDRYIMPKNDFVKNGIDPNSVNIILKTNTLSFEENQKEKASLKQIAEYNSLAKKYNTLLTESRSIQIKKKDVNRLAYLYSLMSEKQKADAEPFPDFPEPPPAPKTPNDAEFANSEIKRIVKKQDPYDVVGRAINLNQPTQPKVPKKIKNVQAENPPQPPVPPKPKSPLDFVIEMAKKGASFMYDGEPISSNKAIDLVKNNKELNIESRNNNGTQIIRINKDPVTID